MIRRKPDDDAELIPAETLSAVRRTTRAHAGVSPSRGHQHVTRMEAADWRTTGADPKQSK
jgi:hypothetical protein